MSNMDLRQAVLTLYRYKHYEDSGVSMEVADEARDVLKSSFASARRWTRTMGKEDQNPEDFIQDFLSTLVNLSADSADAPLRAMPSLHDIPRGEWLEYWLDENGQPVGFTSHYYGMRSDQLQALLDFARLYGLELKLDGHGSWKNAGHTIIAIVKRKTRGV